MNVNLINGAMGLDRLEQGVSQHHKVDQPQFPLAPNVPACDSGGGGDAADDNDGGCDGGGGGEEMG